MRTVTLALALSVAACGGQASLTPDDIGSKTFQFLKADDYTTYFTTIVASQPIVQGTCPGAIGVERFFTTGDGSDDVQHQRWDACRAAVDFSAMSYVKSVVVVKPSELVPPACSLPVQQVDVNVEMKSGADSYYFTVRDVMQFGAGWRAYRYVANCGTTPPP